MVHTVRRTLRGVEQKHMEGEGIAPRAGPALLTGTRAGHRVRTGVAPGATPGSSGSTTTRIQRSVPEPTATAARDESRKGHKPVSGLTDCTA